jgi:predicted nucleotidyltransferase component of viral defense system
VDFSPDSLSRLQRLLLEGIADRAPFYLSGGVALSAFYLHHRRSFDLDLFVSEAEGLEGLERQLKQLCAEQAWSIEEMRRYPGFRRYLVKNADEETLVDLVHEPVVQIVEISEKPRHAGLTVDALDDLVANKLCALLGRGDIKDLVDLFYMDKAGIDVLAYFKAAQLKDGGMEATSLAFVLSGLKPDPVGLLLLQPLSDQDLVAFRDRLIGRLLDAAWPGEHGPAS